MRFSELLASADLVGRRVALSWEYRLDPGETASDLPEQLLRRKMRDFDFPSLVPADPYLVYDSATFPPAPIPGVLTVVDLPDREWFDGGLRQLRSGVSVARVAAGQPEEVMREFRTRTYDPLGHLASLRTELIEAADFPELETLYYELDDGSAPSTEEIARYRSTAFAGKLHGHNRTLWEQLPEVYRSQDKIQIDAAARIAGVHETGGTAGQLRRFIDMFGLGFDLLRNSAEAIARIRDLDQTPPQYLDLLARGIGWVPSDAITLPQRRNETRNATRLFAVNGSIQSLRTMVTQQTGWRSQVAELADNVARSNVAPQGNLYFRREVVGAAALSDWRGGLDAASALAFPPGTVSGAGSAPAVLTSTQTQPFALRPGHELTVVVDGNVPVRIRFSRADFADIAAASASEVCTIINRLLDTVEASVAAGAVRLTTLATGTEASLAIAPVRQSLLSVSELPQGPTAPVTHADGTISLFFRDEQQLVRDAPGENNTPTARVNHIMHKSWGYGLWRDAVALPGWSAEVRDLQACALPDASTLLIWSRPGGLSLGLGRPVAKLPARLVGRTREPFALAAGLLLEVVTLAGSETFTVNPADYAAIGAATAAEVAAAMSGQLVNANATALPDGALRLTSLATGTTALLSIDLTQSTAARLLGFDARELLGRGHWQPGLDWSAPLAGPICWHPVAEPSVVAHPVSGAVAAWAENADGAWQVRQAWLSERLALTTTLGAAERAAPGAPWTLTDTLDGLPSNVVRMVLTDPTGGHWFATDSGLVRRRVDGVLQVFTTLDGLASNDVRAVAQLPSGALACATAAGLTEITVGGVFTTTAASPGGMVSGDHHAIVAEGTGALWVGSSAGIGRRDPQGRWQWWGLADGIPALPIRALAVAPGVPIAAGSAQGVHRLIGASWLTELADLVGAPIPVRDLCYRPDGTLLAATANGLARLHERTWTLLTTFEGLPTNDLTAVATQPDGSILLGTPTGLLVAGVTGGWTSLGVADGLPPAPVARICAGWSTPRILAASVGGDREPQVAVEASGEIWLFWSSRLNPDPQPRDSWKLRLRRFQVASDWTASVDLTTPLPGGSCDGQPRVLSDPAGGFRLTFTTDRNGASDLALLRVSAAGVATPPQVFSATSDRSSNPALIATPAGETWLIHRSDTPLVPAQLALVESDEQPVGPSSLVPDAATVRPQAGALTPVMKHAARHGMRSRFADPQTYTIMRPEGFDDFAGLPAPFYTKRTVAVYMRQSPFGKSVTQDEIARLLQLLNRFKPINLRIALIIAPDPLTEFVYPPGADILESWIDDVPFAETIGPITDSTSVVIPGLEVLIANQLASRSADFIDLTTLRRRTWFPDLL